MKIKTMVLILFLINIIKLEETNKNEETEDEFDIFEYSFNNLELLGTKLLLIYKTIRKDNFYSKFFLSLLIIYFFKNFLLFPFTLFKSKNKNILDPELKKLLIKVDDEIKKLKEISNNGTNNKIENNNPEIENKLTNFIEEYEVCKKENEKFQDELLDLHETLNNEIQKIKGKISNNLNESSNNDKTTNQLNEMLDNNRFNDSLSKNKDDSLNLLNSDKSDKEEIIENEKLNDYKKYNNEEIEEEEIIEETPKTNNSKINNIFNKSKKVIESKVDIKIEKEELNKEEIEKEEVNKEEVKGNELDVDKIEEVKPKILPKIKVVKPINFKPKTQIKRPLPIKRPNNLPSKPQDDKNNLI